MLRRYLTVNLSKISNKNYQICMEISKHSENKTLYIHVFVC